VNDPALRRFAPIALTGEKAAAFMPRCVHFDELTANESPTVE
jgi:hypothetical protein